MKEMIALGILVASVFLYSVNFRPEVRIIEKPVITEKIIEKAVIAEKVIEEPVYVKPKPRALRRARAFPKEPLRRKTECEKEEERLNQCK